MIVKICGITNSSDAHACLLAGADWIGLNLFSGPRKLQTPIALQILDQLDDPAAAVALISIEHDQVIEPTLVALRKKGLRRVQLYGSQAAQDLDRIRSLGLEVVGTVHLRPGKEQQDFSAICARPHGDYLLVDTAVSGKQGGTGVAGNWLGIGQALSLANSDALPPILLAGGLRPENVAEAIGAVGPAGVDVCSGVESSPGCKDHAAVVAFVKAAKRSRGGGAP